MSSVGLQPGEQVQSRPPGSLCLGGRSRLLSSAPADRPLTVVSLLSGQKSSLRQLRRQRLRHRQPSRPGWLDWDTVTWAFATYDAGNWHPLTWLSHALDYQIYDRDPGGHHQTNMLLHALNAVLLFWVCCARPGYTGRSFMVAALFAVHPINVESVVWIAERKTVLSMMFFLLALGAYRWYAAKPKVGRYAVVAVLFALGLMAKPQIITFPFVLLLWDYWPLGGCRFGGTSDCERTRTAVFRSRASTR